MNNYDTSDIELPLFTVDSVLFTIDQGKLKVLLIKRANLPYKGKWGLPGGFMDIKQDSNTDITALRKLKDKTSIIPPYLEQLQIVSSAKRDPRGFCVTAVYYALVAYQKVQSHLETVDDVQWMDVADLSNLNLAFDHANIIEMAQSRLIQKTLYSMIPVYCLNDEFTITDLKNAIEVIVQKTIQRKSLSRRIDSCGMFEMLDKKIKSGGRLSQVYKLKQDVEIVNFERNLNT